MQKVYMCMLSRNVIRGVSQKGNGVLVSILLITFSQTASSETSIQTDWTGGPEAYEVCTQWTDVFISEQNIVWSSSPGSLTLERDDAVELEISNYVSYPGTVHAWDADNDGDQDICCLGASDVSARVFENMGNGLGWAEHCVLSGVSPLNDVATADIDDDGSIDLLLAAGWDGKDSSETYDCLLAWVRNTGLSTPSWEYTVIDQMGMGYSSVCSADINGDGRVDVAGSSVGMDKISWWDNTEGTGYIWQEHIIANIDGAISVETADFNGDGITDAVCAAPQPPQGVIKVLINTDGSGLNWNEITVDPGLNGAQLAYPGDIDGDGDTDIVSLASFDTNIYWYENVDGFGGTEWLKHVVGPGESYRYYNSLVTADLDGDGDTDIAGSGNDWWENTQGNGSDWLLHSIPGNGIAIAAADVVGNGHTDLVSSFRISGMNGTLRVYDLNLYGAQGNLVSQILYTRADQIWGTIDWTGATPANSSISFAVRASDDPENMGGWSDIINSPGSLEGILDNEHSYLQYKAILEPSPDSSDTPVLEQVQISWNPVSIEAESSERIFPDSPFMVPSPCNESISVLCTLESPSTVKISIYSAAGRTVLTETRENQPAGLHTFQYIVPEAGVYFCRASTDEFSEVKSVVVIE